MEDLGDFCQFTLMTRNNSNGRAYFGVTMGDWPAGRIVFELFSDILPMTCENFWALCTGEFGGCETAAKVSLHYKGCAFHRITPQFVVQGGDITGGNGTGSESLSVRTSSCAAHAMPLRRHPQSAMLRRAALVDQSRDFHRLRTSSDGSMVAKRSPPTLDRQVWDTRARQTHSIAQSSQYCPSKRSKR
jgi:cyclophilin family peptidyl-prolyl cis-trans isomerase